METLLQQGRVETDDELIIIFAADKLSIQPDPRFPIEARRPIVLSSAPGRTTHLKIAEEAMSFLFSSHSYVDKRDMYITGSLFLMT